MAGICRTFRSLITGWFKLDLSNFKAIGSKANLLSFFVLAQCSQILTPEFLKVHCESVAASSAYLLMRKGSDMVQCGILDMLLLCDHGR